MALDELIDKQMGLFITCPAALLAPFGALMLSRRVPREAALIVAALLAQLAVFAKYEQWWASSYGPRFLLTSLALSALLVAPLLQRLFAGYSAGRETRSQRLHTGS